MGNMQMGNASLNNASHDTMKGLAVDMNPSLRQGQPSIRRGEASITATFPAAALW
jgi:hypothetical protein